MRYRRGVFGSELGEMLGEYWLIEAGVDQLWQASAYAGTRGECTTALIKHWLSERE